jgi:hypothetical protein
MLTSKSSSFFQFCDVSELVIINKKDLNKFGHKSKKKVEILGTLLYFSSMQNYYNL